MKAFWQKFVHFFVLLTLLGHVAMPSIALAAQCVRTGSACVEGAGTRNINGFPNYQPCWRYEDTYQCTAAVGIKSCGPLEATTGCGQAYIQCQQTGTSGECISYVKKFTCDKDFKLTQPGGKLPNGITELQSTHKITSEWDETECNAMTSQFGSCNNIKTQCSQGAAEKIINGVKVSFPCWEQTKDYQCLGKNTNTTCNDAELNNKCTLKQTTCINTMNGVCQTGENVYQCVIKEGSTTPSSSCSDPDFGKVMAGLEGAREFARYFDESTLTFFKGDPARCTVKLSGVIGGDCCKPSGDPNNWTDAAVGAAVNYAIGQLASAYTYEVLLVNSSTILSSVAGAASAVGAGATIAPSISTFGVGASVGSGGSLTLMINPVMLVAAIVIMVVMEWLACEPEEKKTALRNKAGLCHHVGSYCAEKVLGACISKAESYCCYISKLARIINEQGREQINKPWTGTTPGSPIEYTMESPNCTGFTEKEIGQLDFGKMNLDEFIADIKHITPDSIGIGQRNQNTANQMLNTATTPTTNNSTAGSDYYAQ